MRECPDDDKPSTGMFAVSDDIFTVCLLFILSQRFTAEAQNLELNTGEKSEGSSYNERDYNSLKCSLGAVLMLLVDVYVVGSQGQIYGHILIHVISATFLYLLTCI